MAGPYRTPVPLFAGGTIVPSSFIKLSTSADRQVLQAGLNDKIFGVAQVGGHDFQDISQAQVAAASAGQEVGYFIQGEPCLLYSGTGGWNPGDFLKSDASGYGIVGRVGIDNIGARAIDAAVAGRYGYVVPLFQFASGSAAASVRAVTANTSLTAADSGSTLELNSTTSLNINLPPVSTLVAGDSFRIVTQQVGSSTGHKFTINAADTGTVYIYGKGMSSPAAGNGSINTTGTAAIGDLLRVTFDGTLFVITEELGTWAKV